MKQANILIIGGGASGLTAAGALKHEGVDSVILDERSAVGDIWRQRYDRLRLHTIKGLSHMAYHRMPDVLPRYVPKEQFADYMQAYAKHFQLNIQHNSKVKQVSQADGGWRVDMADGESWSAKHVIIASGINRIPNMPKWAGKDGYQGTFLHAVDYKRGGDFKGKRVLVVGSGNTGSEICADLIEQGATSVTHSIRTFPSIVPRDPFGIPIHVWGVMMSPLPTFLKDGIVAMTAWLHQGDLSKYGVKAPEWKVFADGRIPMIDVGYVEQLKAGKVTVRPNVESFTADGVRFVDGQTGTFDVVIAATGYRTGLQEFLQLPKLYDDEGHLLVTCGEATPYAGLWFVGLVDSPAGVIMAARMQSRKLAKTIAKMQG